MQYVEADGLRISRIGLGAWQFGSREWAYGQDHATRIAPALLRRALRLGVTLVDTAEAYGLGRSEAIIGQTLAALPADERDRLVVATKFMPIAPAEAILARQVAASRGRPGMDALDLYYAHWPNPLVSTRRVMQSLRPLVAAGVVRRVAVSNHSLDQWQAAERALRAPVVANQVRFSLLDARPARDLVPYAAARDRLVVAYSPLAQGLLSGAATTATTRGMRAWSPRFRPSGRERFAPLLGALRDVAAAHGATSRTRSPWRG